MQVALHRRQCNVYDRAVDEAETGAENRCGKNPAGLRRISGDTRGLIHLIHTFLVGLEVNSVTCVP